ncbi:hypothetical protein WAF17_16395 [Bernardetia sp. ABR2-2B]|uniref:hypothetical protein n=1 Tax=Bernardetia sp. ABR2-2B TaxID=3127472 RepID=UPI0030CD3DC6
MKNYKFLLFAFMLLIFATPLFSFDFEDDFPDKETSQKVILNVAQEKEKTRLQDEGTVDIFDLSKCDFYSPNMAGFSRNDARIVYNDAVDLHSRYHLANPTKAITVTDLSRNYNPFRFLSKSNRIFIASNLQSDSNDKA